MKETQFTSKDLVKNVKEISIEKKTVFIGHIRPKKGHTLFEYNFVTQKINPAEYDAPPVVKYTDAIKGKVAAKRKITKKKNCLYVSALNKKNAIKILKRELDIEIKL